MREPVRTSGAAYPLRLARRSAYSAPMSGTNLRPPIATIGLHCSASTWVFNVVRELIIAARGEAGVRALYTEVVADHFTLPSDVWTVIKSHHGSPALDEWLTNQQATLILSIRDPRDAILSMASRFSVDLAECIEAIAGDCRRLQRLAPQADLLLRYEDRFFDKLRSVERIAAVLGIQLPPATIDGIFKRYCTESVRAFAHRLAELPSDRIARVGSSHLVDKVTHVHGPHIGDTRSGKWRDLAASRQTDISHRFLPFLRQFGYPA